MQPINRIAGIFLEQPVRHHRLRALSRFLGRLKNQVDRAIEIRIFAQVFRRPQQHDRMPVMPAPVHLAGNP